MSQSSPQTGILGSLVIEQLNDLVYAFDRELHFLYVNETACGVLGYAREELLGASAAVIGAEALSGGDTGWDVGQSYTAETSLLSRGGRDLDAGDRACGRAGAVGCGT
jgi:PAS domain-containing protein